MTQAPRCEVWWGWGGRRTETPATWSQCVWNVPSVGRQHRILGPGLCDTWNLTATRTVTRSRVFRGRFLSLYPDLMRLCPGDTCWACTVSGDSSRNGHRQSC